MRILRWIDLLWQSHNRQCQCESECQWLRLNKNICISIYIIRILILISYTINYWMHFLDHGCSCWCAYDSSKTKHFIQTLPAHRRGHAHCWCFRACWQSRKSQQIEYTLNAEGATEMCWRLSTIHRIGSQQIFNSPATRNLNPPPVVIGWVLERLKYTKTILKYRGLRIEVHGSLLSTCEIQKAEIWFLPLFECIWLRESGTPSTTLP